MSGSDDVFNGMARTLECFKAWLDNGDGGPGWSLEPENHEGWRVVIDEGELFVTGVCICCDCVAGCYVKQESGSHSSIATSRRHHGP